MKAESIKTIAKYILLFSVMSLCPPGFAQTAGQGGTRPAAAHDREFWRAIAKNKFAVPAGQDAFALVGELSGYLGSRDPELRDELAYSIIYTWIVEQKQFSPGQLNALLDQWQGNLRSGVGVPDGVLTRSFSALCLAVLAERDLSTPFLSEERYRKLLTESLAYLVDETDLRGFDPAVGWIHATAHTADLIAQLSSNALLRVEDQGRVLDAVGKRISSAPEVYTFGEQDRLAAAVATIVERKDFDLAAFQKWLTALDEEQQGVWKDFPPKLGLLKSSENQTYMLRGLAAYLSAKPLGPAATNAQKTVLGVLAKR
jgi:hypothetical protein